MAENKFTAEEKCKAARREIGQRKYVYPNRVQAGKMTQALADREIAIMQEIMADYEALAEKDRLL